MFYLRKEQDFIDALSKCNFLLHKTHLKELHCFEAYPPSPNSNPIRLIKIESFGDCNHLSFFTYTLNAVASMNCSIAYIIQSTCSEMSFYIGLKDTCACSVGFNMLHKGLSSTFPSAKFIPVPLQDTSCILGDLFNPQHYDTLSSTTVVPGSTTPIIPSFIQLLQKEFYTLFLLAEPTCNNCICNLTHELMELFNIISAFTQTNFHHFNGISKNSSHTLSNGDTDGHSLACTESCSTASSCSENCYTNISPSTSLPIPNSSPLNLGLTFNTASGLSSSTTNANIACKTNNTSCSKTTSDLSGIGTVNNRTTHYSAQNKCALECLDALTILLNRLKNSTNHSFFNFSAYTLSNSMSTSIRAAYTYGGLAANTSTYRDDMIVNTWCKDSPCFNDLLCTLSHFDHPCFIQPNCPPIQATTLITAPEFLNTLYLCTTT